MNAKTESDLTPVSRTHVERKSDREIIVRRTFDGPARLVFEAWTQPDLLKRWWVPKSMGMSFLACEVDARTGGKYRFEFLHPSSPEPVAFFGKYLDVVPHSRLVWSNEESNDGAVTTVTFEEKNGKTLLVVHEIYPSKEALEVNGGMENAMPETFSQLDELLAELGARR